MIVLKLGGSVITRKDEPETVDEAALARAAAGGGGGRAGPGGVDRGGSFGHHHADAHGVTPESGTRDAGAALAIHDAMRRLNGAVVESLQEAGAPALPVHPLSAAHRADGDLSLPAGAVETMLGEGFLPVAHGDVIAEAGEGVTVVSGDELAVELARALGADRVGMCSTVSGVLDDDGRVIERVDALADAPLGDSDATDVTGGMAGKVAALLEVDAEAAVFGLDDLPAFLAGERVGTSVGGR